MERPTKISLSPAEQELVCNSEWILTKHRIIDKVYGLFGELAGSMQARIKEQAGSLPVEAIESSPKISRGENYRMLPYVMLDYPRHFTRTSTLAIRTLFWWGNFFSINLQLSGDCKERVLGNLGGSHTQLQRDGFWICTGDQPWEHHFEEGNYEPVAKFDEAAFSHTLHRMPFIKLAARIGLDEWESAPAFLETRFREMIEMLRVSSPGGEKGLSPGTPTTGSGL